MKSRVILVLVTAIVTAVLTSALWIAGLAVTSWYFNTGQPQFVVTVDAPAQVKVGDEAVLTMKARNPTDQPIELGSIDVYDSLLDGFQVLSTRPKPDDRAHHVAFETFYFRRTLGPDEEFEATVRLKAVKPGLWSGDVDFCTPEEKFVTAVATIRVIDPAGP